MRAHSTQTLTHECHLLLVAAEEELNKLRLMMAGEPTLSKSFSLKVQVRCMFEHQQVRACNTEC